MISQDNKFILQPTGLTVTKSGSGVTINTGQEVSAGMFYSGSDIDSSITAVTDISDPASTGGWTDLLTLSGGPFLFRFYSSAALLMPRIAVNAAEDSGDSIRMQILIDGVIVWDVQAIGDNSGSQTAELSLFRFETSCDYHVSIFCASSLTIRAARKGAFTNGGSMIRTEDIIYEYVRRA